MSVGETTVVAKTQLTDSLKYKIRQFDSYMAFFV